MELEPRFFLDKNLGQIIIYSDLKNASWKNKIYGFKHSETMGI